MPRFIFLGVNHFDPLGPRRVTDTLKTLADIGVTFDCICVEWDEETAKMLISHRNNFMNYLTDNNEIGLTPTTIQLVTNSLAYEADVCLAADSDACVVWLDNGRKIETLEGYFKFRYNVLAQQRLLHQEVDLNDINVLSKNLWAISLTDYDIGENDIDRNNTIFTRIQESDPNRFDTVLVLVGAKHAQLERENSTAQLLVKAGFNVESVILNSDSSS